MRWSLLFGALVLGCGPPDTSGAAKEPGPTRAPDVVIITVDTLRADRVGAWGHAEARTPTMDALAARGARFDAAITPQPRTTPGLASLWTGLWPHHHGAREVHWPRQAGTLVSEVLQARGYVTRAVSANAAAGPDTGLDTGFDRFEVRTSGEASEITEIALELADALEASPLLLWVHYYDPHAPYAPPEAADPPPSELCSRVQTEERWNDALSNRTGISARAFPECSALYDAEVAWSDRHIAMVVERLRARGRLKHGFLIFTSDHGEGMGERGLWYEHGPNVHGSNLRVQLAISGIGIEPGRVVGQAASLADLAPTLYDLLEIPDDARPEMDGQSLAPALRGEEDPERMVTAESSTALTRFFPHGLMVGRAGVGYCLNGARFAYCWNDPREPPTLHDREADPQHEVDLAPRYPEECATLEAARRRWSWSYGREYAVRDARFKLLSRPRIEGGYDRTLYDLAEDPGEANDVSAAHPEVRARLERWLEAWEQGLPHYEAPMALSPDQEAALRAMGYIE